MSYRKYWSNCPRSNGCAKRSTISKNAHMQLIRKYSRQNVLKTATIRDGFDELACCLCHALGNDYTKNKLKVMMILLKFGTHLRRSHGTTKQDTINR